MEVCQGRNALKITYRSNQQDNTMYIDFNVDGLNNHLSSKNNLHFVSISGPALKNKWLRVLCRNCTQLPDPTLEEIGLIGPEKTNSSNKIPAIKVNYRTGQKYAHDYKS